MQRALLVSALLLLAPGSFAAEAAPEPDRFDIVEYRVLGNTVLEPIVLERLLYPHLGPEQTLDDVQAVRGELERLYRDLGFGAVYVDIPEQTVSEGIVRLQVTEGRLGRVRLTEARYFSGGRIRAELPALQQGETLHLPTFQQELAVANQHSRDRVITPILKAGAQPGSVDVELSVKDSLPLHGSIDVNNRYTANTTKTRTSLNLSYDNLFQKYHSLSLTWQASPERFKDSRVLALTYTAPLASGDSLVFYVVDTNSDFAVVANDLSVLGQGRIFGARFNKKLPVGADFFHGLSLGVDVKDFTDNIDLPGDVEDSTPIRYAVWSAAYSGGLNAGASATSFSLTLNAGLGGLFNQTQEFIYKRYKARPSFFALRSDVSYDHPLWRATLHTRLAAQWTPSPLISNEQFGIGGADSVRGYLESARMAEQGLLGSLELRSPSLGALVGLSQSNLVVYGFYDIGAITVLQFIESTQDENGQVENIVIPKKGYQLASAGVGIRFAGLHGLNATLDWAYPLDDAAATARGNARLHFRLNYGF